MLGDGDLNNIVLLNGISLTDNSILKAIDNTFEFNGITWEIGRISGRNSIEQSFPARQYDDNNIISFTSDNVDFSDIELNGGRDFFSIDNEKWINSPNLNEDSCGQSDSCDNSVSYASLIFSGRLINLTDDNIPTNIRRAYFYNGKFVCDIDNDTYYTMTIDLWSMDLISDGIYQPAVFMDKYIYELCE